MTAITFDATQTQRWIAFDKDKDGFNRMHPLWLWDPFNEWKNKNNPGADPLTLTCPMDGLGVYFNQYASAVTKSVYWKMKVTNNYDSGIVKMFVIVTDFYNSVDAIVNENATIASASNGKVVTIGPGKTRTIKLRINPQQWARMRQENRTNTRIQFGKPSEHPFTDRRSYTTPSYEPWINIWCIAPFPDPVPERIDVEITQFNKVMFFNKRAPWLLESEALEGENSTFDPEVFGYDTVAEDTIDPAAHNTILDNIV